MKRIEAAFEDLRKEDLPVAVRSWRVEETESRDGDPAVFVWTLLEPGGITGGRKVGQRNALERMAYERLGTLVDGAVMLFLYDEAEAETAP